MQIVAAAAELDAALVSERRVAEGPRRSALLLEPNRPARASRGAGAVRRARPGGAPLDARMLAAAAPQKADRGTPAPGSRLPCARG